MPLSLAKCTYAGTVGFKIADHPTSAKVEKIRTREVRAAHSCKYPQNCRVAGQALCRVALGRRNLDPGHGCRGKDSAIKHVIPADQKWFARHLISEAIVGTLEDVDPHYPEMHADQMARLASSRDSLCGKEG